MWKDGDKVSYAETQEDYQHYCCNGFKQLKRLNCSLQRSPLTFLTGTQSKSAAAVPRRTLVAASFGYFGALLLILGFFWGALPWCRCALEVHHHNQDSGMKAKQKFSFRFPRKKVFCSFFFLYSHTHTHDHQTGLEWKRRALSKCAKRFAQDSTAAPPPVYAQDASKPSK